MIDMFTKWPEAFSFSAATTEVVVTHLTKDIFPHFGLPATLHSDRRTHFVATKVNKMTTTPAYHAVSNPVERFNQDLGKGLMYGWPRAEQIGRKDSRDLRGNQPHIRHLAEAPS